MAGDFNIPGFDWKRSLSVPNSHFYSKLKGDGIYTSARLLNLIQSTGTVGNSNLLDLVFSKLSDLYITPLDPGLVRSDN
jgi:hypothetical protein